MSGTTSELREPSLPAAPPLGVAGRAPPLLGRLGRLLPGKGLSSLFDQGVVAGSSFATSVVIGRLGSREDLGTYALAMTVVLFLRGVQGELTTSPYTIHCHRREGEEREAYTGSTLLHHVCFTVLAMAVMAGAAILCSRGAGPASLTPVLAILVGVLPFLLLRECFRQLSLSNLRLGAVLTLDGTAAVLQLGALAVLGYFSLLTIRMVFVSLGGACAVACGLWLLICRQPMRLVAGQVKADWLCNWSFGKWSLAGCLVGSATTSSVPWLLFATHGEAATGVLAACTTVINLSGTYVTGVANLLTPQAARAYSRGGLPELRGVLKRTALLFLVSLGGFCLVILLTGDLAARLVYGGRYAGTGTILSLLAITMLVNSLSITAGNGLWALNRPKANFAADLCMMSASLLAVFLLVSPLGVLGAALTLLVGACVGGAVRWLTLLRCARAVARGTAAGGPLA